MRKHNITSPSGRLDALESRFALRVAARLNEHARELPHDVTERLRVARGQALERARIARKSAVAADVQPLGSGAAALMSFGNPGSSWWFKFASVLPVVALVGGLLLIQHAHLKSRIAAAAEIDAALLADDVPPAAYSDPGFVEFLKAPRD
jgi:hypothetical protein